MSTPIKVIQLDAEGITTGFIAKGQIEKATMIEACKLAFTPSVYEDTNLRIDNILVRQGYYRWVPTRDEYGDYCGSRLMTTSAAGNGAFFGTELILNG